MAWCRLLTIDRLKRFGWSIPNRCFLCKYEEETTYHLLLFCEKARMLWLLIFSIFGVQWVIHFSVKRNLLGWHGSFVGKKREKAWRAAPLCLMWTIWKERNRRAFDDIERNDQDIKSMFLYTFMNWVRVYIEKHTLFVRFCRLASHQVRVKLVYLFVFCLFVSWYILCIPFL